MLYYIFRFLEQYNIPGAHLWSYISFRSLLALILSLIISAWFGEYFIKWMKRRNISETARDPSIDPLSSHYGRYYHHCQYIGTSIVVGTYAKHLSPLDDWYHHLAWLPWFYG